MNKLLDVLFVIVHICDLPIEHRNVEIFQYAAILDDAIKRD